MNINTSLFRQGGIIFFYCFLCFVLITSCTTTKNVAYFEDLTDTSKIYTQVIKSTYEIRIQPDDIIEIIVNNLNAEAAAPFNLGNINPAASPTTQIMQGASGLRLNTPSTNTPTGEGYL